MGTGAECRVLYTITLTSVSERPSGKNTVWQGVVLIRDVAVGTLLLLIQAVIGTGGVRTGFIMVHRAYV